MKYDCAIIGGGLSGLAAGVRLAHFGKKVRLIERNTRLGGLNTYYRMSGHDIESGLHAVTNFQRKDGNKSSPLLRLLRQLRMKYEDARPVEQNYSVISFPSAQLSFDNSGDRFHAETATHFPTQIDRLRHLEQFIESYDCFGLSRTHVSARQIVSHHITDPLLAEMLFCPLMYYGSATPDDMDFAQFAIMYQSIFKEGFWRPEGGVKRLLSLIESRFLECGGELTLGKNVKMIRESGGCATALVLDNEEVVEADMFLSSIGSHETASLCELKPTPAPDVRLGDMGFFESVALLRPPVDATGPAIIFRSENDVFEYRNPADPVSLSSMVVCRPDNFRYRDGAERPEPCLRATVLARHQFWLEARRDEYVAAKRKTAAEILAKAAETAGVRDVFQTFEPLDAFTPKTIRRYTGHLNGAVYGAPDKILDGSTRLGNLFLCGTDQGFLGITGSMLSGISIANARILR